MSAVDVSAGALCDVAWVSAVEECAVGEPECLW